MVSTDDMPDMHASFFGRRVEFSSSKDACGYWLRGIIDVRTIRPWGLSGGDYSFAQLLTCQTEIRTENIQGATTQQVADAMELKLRTLANAINFPELEAAINRATEQGVSE